MITAEVRQEHERFSVMSAVVDGDINALREKVKSWEKRYQNEGCPFRHEYFNFSNETRQSPLHLAALNGRLEIARLILDTPETKINAINGKGDTALHLAAREEFFDICCLLADRKALIVRNFAGETPLAVTKSPSIGSIVLCREQEITREQGIDFCPGPVGFNTKGVQS